MHLRSAVWLLSVSRKFSGFRSLCSDGVARKNGVARRNGVAQCVPVNDAHFVAVGHHLDDGAADSRGVLLAIVAELGDAVKQLATGAQLHHLGMRLQQCLQHDTTHNVDGPAVLVHRMQGDNVGVSCEVVHDLDLTLHVLHILL